MNKFLLKLRHTKNEQEIEKLKKYDVKELEKYPSEIFKLLISNTNKSKGFRESCDCLRELYQMQTLPVHVSLPVYRVPASKNDNTTLNSVYSPSLQLYCLKSLLEPSQSHQKIKLLCILIVLNNTSFGKVPTILDQYFQQLTDDFHSAREQNEDSIVKKASSKFDPITFLPYILYMIPSICDAAKMESFLFKVLLQIVKETCNHALPVLQSNPLLYHNITGSMSMSNMSSGINSSGDERYNEQEIYHFLTLFCYVTPIIGYISQFWKNINHSIQNNENMELLINIENGLKKILVETSTLSDRKKSMFGGSALIHATEPDGSPVNGFFTVLNSNNLLLSFPQILHIYLFSSVRSLFYVLPIAPYSQTMNEEKRKQIEAKISEEQKKEQDKWIQQHILIETMIQYCFRLLHQAEIILNLKEHQKLQHGYIFLESTAIEAIRILDTICTLYPTQIYRVIGTVKKFFQLFCDSHFSIYSHYQYQLSCVMYPMTNPHQQTSSNRKRSNSNSSTNSNAPKSNSFMRPWDSSYARKMATTVSHTVAPPSYFHTSGISTSMLPPSTFNTLNTKGQSPTPNTPNSPLGSSKLNAASSANSTNSPSYANVSHPLNPTQIKDVCHYRSHAGVIVLELMKFFLHHKNSLTYDVQPIIHKIFTEQIPLYYQDSMFTLELFTLLIQNREMISKETNIFHDYYPCLLKIFTFMPHSVIEELMVLFPYILHEENMIDVFHRIIDLPLLTLLLDQPTLLNFLQSATIPTASDDNDEKLDTPRSITKNNNFYSNGNSNDTTPPPSSTSNSVPGGKAIYTGQQHPLLQSMASSFRSTEEWVKESPELLPHFLGITISDNASLTAPISTSPAYVDSLLFCTKFGNPADASEQLLNYSIENQTTGSNVSHSFLALFCDAILRDEPLTEQFFWTRQYQRTGENIINLKTWIEVMDQFSLTSKRSMHVARHVPKLLNAFFQNINVFMKQDMQRLILEKVIPEILKRIDTLVTINNAQSNFFHQHIQQILLDYMLKWTKKPVKKDDTINCRELNNIFVQYLNQHYEIVQSVAGSVSPMPTPLLPSSVTTSKRYLRFLSIMNHLRELKFSLIQNTTLNLTIYACNCLGSSSNQKMNFIRSAEFTKQENQLHAHHSIGKTQDYDEALVNYFDLMEVMVYEVIAKVKIHQKTQMQQEIENEMDSSDDSDARSIASSSDDTSQRKNQLDHTVIAQFLNVIIQSILKLSLQCPDLVPRAMVCLANISKQGVMLHESVIQSSNHALRLLKFPSIASATLT